MEFNEVIEKRRSIRKYKDKKVDHDLIEQCIQAAILSPSWKNAQSARYHVVESEDMLKKVKAQGLPEFNAKNCLDAPVLVVCSFIKDRAGFERDGTPSNEVGQGWGYYDCGLHNMNFLLKARELGLGTLVMGIRDSNKLRELLNIADNEIITSVIALGYPDETPEKPKRKALEEITTFY